MTMESGDSVHIVACVYHHLPTMRRQAHKARLQLMHLDLVIFRCFLFETVRSPIPSSGQHDERAIT